MVSSNQNKEKDRGTEIHRGRKRNNNEMERQTNGKKWEDENK